MNIATQINDVIRHVDFDDVGNEIALTRTFPTTVDDLWDACTDPERLARWFEPVSGDLRVGGDYRMGDSGTTGRILACDAPRSLTITWEYGDDASRVSADIEADGDGARLTLRHHGEANEHWEEYGPAAGGAGWDAALLGLDMHLADPRAGLDDLASFMTSSDGKTFVEEVIARWSAAHQESGAPAPVADEAARRALALEREQWQG